MLLSFIGRSIFLPWLTCQVECSAESILGNWIDGSESKKLDSAVKGLSIDRCGLEVENDCLTLIRLKLNVGATFRLDIARWTTPGDGPQTASDYCLSNISSSVMSKSCIEAILFTLMSGRRLLWNFRFARVVLKGFLEVLSSYKLSSTLNLLMFIDAWLSSFNSV